jgi:hypothetical protein
MKDKIGKNIQWIKRVKKILANSSDEIKKKIKIMDSMMKSKIN